MAIKGTKVPPSAKAAKAPKDPKAPKPTAAETAAAKSAAKESEKAIAATAKPHVHRLDLGESLPPQADALNPNRAK